MLQGWLAVCLTRGAAAVQCVNVSGRNLWGLMRVLIFGLALSSLAACDSVQSASDRADRSYDDARSAAAAAGVYLPDRSFVERHSARPPAETAPWIVTIARDDMRERELVTACTPSIGAFKAILCVEQRIGEDTPVVSVEAEDRLDCFSDCEVAARFGDGAVQNFGVAGTRAKFTLQGRRNDNLAARVRDSNVVFVEGAFERGAGERQQMQFATGGLAQALEWRPPPQTTR